MGSASREALAQARTALGDQVAAGVGSELLSASAQIGDAPALAGVLGDPSAETEAKTQLVGRLFGGYGAEARQILVAAVSARWSNVGEFVEGLEELGLRAAASSDPALADELLAAADTIDSSHELELGLGSKLADPAKKLALVDRLFAGRLSEAAVAVVSHIVAHPRGRRLNVALRHAARVAADQRGTELATVTVAAPLAAPQQERLAAYLAQSVGRSVKITTVVDPEVLGGVRIQLADDVIDGSVRARLDDLRQKLAG